MEEQYKRINVSGVDVRVLIVPGTSEAAWHGYYSGMASSEALQRRGKTEFFTEGITENIGVNTNVNKVMKEIKSALETNCYYTGSRNWKELYGSYEIEK